MPPDPDRRARGGRDHLSTAHLLADLIPRSLRGGAITMAGQVVKVAAQVAAIVILARLLAPWDFGLFAMVAVFLTILELFKDLGLSTATVQRPEITSRQVSTLFWLNTALGALMACLLAALGPALAWFYDEPVLIDVALALTVTFLLTGLAAQHLALLRRQMRFVSVTAVQVGSELLALVAAVVAAYADFGIWALVAQRLVWAAAVAAGAWAFCSWRPGLPGPFAEVRALVAFGGNTTASMTIGYAASNLDKVLIGWYWGATPLGLFERTQKLVLLPVLNLNVPLATVALSALSRLTGDPERYRRAYVFAVERLALLLAPAGGLLVAGAGPVVAAVFGEKWTDAVPILAWLGAAMFFLPVIYALSWLYMSQDHRRDAAGERNRRRDDGGGGAVRAALRPGRGRRRLHDQRHRRARARAVLARRTAGAGWHARSRRASGGACDSGSRGGRRRVARPPLDRRRGIAGGRAHRARRDRLRRRARRLRRLPARPQRAARARATAAVGRHARRRGAYSPSSG